MVDSKKNQILNKVNDTTFKLDAVEKSISTVIGDEKQKDFYPRIKVKKWDNEVNLSMGVISSIEDQKITKKDNKIIWEQGNQKANFYPIDESSSGYEFDYVIDSKPDTNVFEFSIESKNLSFHYQPFLTDKEKKSNPGGRPINVEGSYAVYHSEKKGDYSSIGGKNYETGKVCHIYRPKIIDATGKWAWGILHIDEKRKILSITVPQSILDNGVYPITIDPTLGYTTAGSGSITIGGSTMLLNKPFIASSNGTISKITGYLDNNNKGTANAKMCVYRVSDNALIAGDNTGVSLSSTPSWIDSNAVTGNIVSGTEYYLGVKWDLDSGCGVYNDNVGTSNYKYFTGTETYSNNFAATGSFVDASIDNCNISVYATYTDSLPTFNNSAKANIASSTKNNYVTSSVRGAPGNYVKAYIYFEFPSNSVKANISNDRYWVGGSGNWTDDTNHWSLSSGGSPASGNLPTYASNIYFDSNSSLSGGTVTLDIIQGDCNNFSSTTGVNYTITTSSTFSPIYIHGSSIFESGLTIDFSNYLYIIFYPEEDNQTITSNGCDLKLVVNSNGVYGGCILQDNFLSSYGFVNQGGNFDANDHNVTTGNVYSQTGNINMGSGIWEITGNDSTLLFVGILQTWVIADTTLNAETSTLKFTDTSSTRKTFLDTNATPTYHDLWITGSCIGDYLFYGNNTFSDFKVDTPPHDIKFIANTTNTVSSFTVNGEVNKLIKFSSSGSINTSNSVSSVSTVVDDNSIGTVAWSNPTNVLSSNNSYSTLTFTGDQTAHYLKATNFDFSIPENEIIYGIMALVECKNNQGYGVMDYVRIVKGGVIGSVNRTLPMSTTEEYTASGGDSDLWGETWTASDINSSDFGVAISSLGTNGTIIDIDHIEIVVYYGGDARHYLSKSSGIVNCDYLDLSNSNAVGGATWYSGSHSVDSGENTGWIFTKLNDSYVKANLYIATQTYSKDNTAKASIVVKNISNANNSKASIKTTNSNSQNTKSNILVHASASQQSKASVVVKNIANSNSAKASIVVTNISGLQVKSNIKSVITKDNSSKSSIVVANNYPQSTKASVVRVNETKPSSAKASIVVKNIVSSQQVKSNISPKFSNQAKASIKVTNLNNNSAKADIKRIESKDSSAKADIKVTSSSDQSSKASIVVRNSNNNSAKASIITTNLSANFAKASIVTTNSFSQSAKTNIKAIISKDNSTKSSITTTNINFQNQSKANIFAVSNNSSSSKANIVVTNLNNQSAKSNIGGRQSQQVKASIVATNTNSQSSKANILSIGILNSNTAKSNILVRNNTKDNSVKTDILVSNNTKNNSVKSSIVTTNSNNQSSKSNIKAVTTKDSSVKASIVTLSNYPQSVKADIVRVNEKVSQSTKASIVTTSDYSQFVKTNILRTYSTTVYLLNEDGSYALNENGDLIPLEDSGIYSKASIVVSNLNSQFSIGNILVSNNVKSNSAKASIVVSNSFNNNSKANIVTPQANFAKASIVVTNLKSQQSKSDIIRIGEKLNQSAKSNILVRNNSSGNNTKADILKISTANNTAKASIVTLNTFSQSSKADIKSTISKDNNAKASVVVANNYPQFTKANILVLDNKKNSNAKANILITWNFNQLTKASIVRTEIKNNNVKADIFKTTSVSQNSKANVVVTNQHSNTATANVLHVYNNNYNYVKSNIIVATSVENTVKASIKEVFIFPSFVKASIVVTNNFDNNVKENIIGISRNDNFVKASIIKVQIYKSKPYQTKTAPIYTDTKSPITSKAQVITDRFGEFKRKKNPYKDLL